MFKTDEEKARIKNMTAEYEAQRAALKDVYKENDTLEREIDRRKAALNCSCRERIDDINSYLSMLPAKPAPLGQFIMQIYKQQADIGDVLKQTDEEHVLRMLTMESFLYYCQILFT